MARRPVKKSDQAHVPHAPSRDSRQLVVRVHRDLGDFVDREITRIRDQNPGLDVTASDVVRMALRRLRAEREGGAA